MLLSRRTNSTMTDTPFPNVSKSIPAAAGGHFPVLSLSTETIAGLGELDSAFLSDLWGVISKCKDSLHDGRRLENLSWRLWFDSGKAQFRHHDCADDCADDGLFPPTPCSTPNVRRTLMLSSVPAPSPLSDPENDSDDSDSTDSERDPSLHPDARNRSLDPSNLQRLLSQPSLLSRPPRAVSRMSLAEQNPHQNLTGNSLKKMIAELTALPEIKPRPKTTPDVRAPPKAQPKKIKGKKNRNMFFISSPTSDGYSDGASGASATSGASGSAPRVPGAAAAVARMGRASGPGATFLTSQAASPSASQAASTSASQAAPVFPTQTAQLEHTGQASRTDTTSPAGRLDSAANPPRSGRSDTAARAIRGGSRPRTMSGERTHAPAHAHTLRTSPKSHERTRAPLAAAVTKKPKKGKKVVILLDDDDASSWEDDDAEVDGAPAADEAVTAPTPTAPTPATATAEPAPPATAESESEWEEETTAPKPKPARTNSTGNLRSKQQLRSMMMTVLNQQQQQQQQKADAKPNAKNRRHSALASQLNMSSMAKQRQPTLTFEKRSLSTANLTTVQEEDFRPNLVAAGPSKLSQLFHPDLIESGKNATSTVDLRAKLTKLPGAPQNVELEDSDSEEEEGVLEMRRSSRPPVLPRLPIAAEQVPTPLSTRRAMIATELSESVRKNLLWERQIRQKEMELSDRPKIERRNSSHSSRTSHSPVAHGKTRSPSSQMQKVPSLATMTALSTQMKKVPSTATLSNTQAYSVSVDQAPPAPSGFLSFAQRTLSSQAVNKLSELAHKATGYNAAAPSQDMQRSQSAAVQRSYTVGAHLNKINSHSSFQQLHHHPQHVGYHQHQSHHKKKNSEAHTNVGGQPSSLKGHGTGGLPEWQQSAFTGFNDRGW